MAGNMAKVVENLLSKCKTLNSKSQYHQKEREKDKER
jgi:hypothetical protein